MSTEVTNEDLRTADVLLVEPSTQHAELASRAIQDTCPAASIDIVTTCEQALYYFFRAGRYAARDDNAPRLILLNATTPGIGAIEVLERLRRDRVGCMIPVVVMSLSAATELARLFCSRGASSFVAVPMEAFQYMALVRQIAGYWLNINVSPRKAT